MNESERGNGGEGSGRLETATLGGGCFWCIEAVMQRVDGVQEVVSGYAGGHVANPTYEAVCRGDTGHAEVVRIGFDPEEVSFRDLLEIFFTVHDPTTRDRQGPDVGSQYRSIVLTESTAQQEVAEETIRELEAEGTWDRPVATEVVPLETFYPAEGHHQDYYRRNPGQPYCRVMIEPKLAKLRQRHADKIRSE